MIGKFGDILILQSGNERMNSRLDLLVNNLYLDKNHEEWREDRWQVESQIGRKARPNVN